MNRFCMVGNDRWVMAIMAKAPRAGGVKTRLCLPFSAEEAAAELCRAFVLDTIEQVRTLEAATHAIADTPGSAGRGTYRRSAQLPRAWDIL